MNKKSLKFSISGKDADTVAREIQELLNEQYNYKTEISVDKDKIGENTTKGIDPATLIGLIIALPGTVLATLDVYDRIKKKKQLDTTKEQIRKIINKREVSVKFILPNSVVKEVTTTESSEILDEFST